MTRQRFELALSSYALLNFFSFETAENLDLLGRNGKQIIRLIQEKNAHGSVSSCTVCVTEKADKKYLREIEDRRKKYYFVIIVSSSPSGKFAFLQPIYTLKAPS